MAQGLKHAAEYTKLAQFNVGDPISHKATGLSGKVISKHLAIVCGEPTGLVKMGFTKSLRSIPLTWKCERTPGISGYRTSELKNRRKARA